MRGMSLLVEKVKIMLVENVMGESVGGKSESQLNISVAESVSNSHLSAEKVWLNGEKVYRLNQISPSQ